MLVTLLLVAALGEAAAPSLSAGERMPVVAAVLTPADQGTTPFSVTAVLGVLADVLDEGGLFRLAPLDPSVERCVGRPSCVVDVVRASVDDSDERRPRLLLVISLRGDGYVVPITYDWPRALEIVAAGGDPDDLDAALFDRAVLRRPGATEATTVERLRAGLAAAVGDLEVAAQDVPGQLELEVDRPGVDVELDGRALGRLDVAGVTRLVDVRAGKRIVVLRHEDVVERAEVTVAARGVVRHSVRFELLDPPFPHVVIWPSVGLAAAGAALIAVGAERASGLRHACGLGCDTSAFARTFPGEGAGAGPLAVPLGLSFIAAGATYTATALVLGPDAEWWVAPTLGLAVGLLGYGVAEATQSTR